MIRRPPFSPRGSIRAIGWARVAILASFLAGACSGTSGLGEACDRTSDCDAELQCVASVCQPHCVRRTDCGDGLVCDPQGLCVEATVASGGACRRELDCAAGLACRLGNASGGGGALDATCGADQPGAGLDALCTDDDDCRNGTCALGRCVDLCVDDLDCPLEHACASMPRLIGRAVTRPIVAFSACLPASGLLSWPLPVAGPRSEVMLGVPSTARSISVVIEGADPLQSVGLVHLSAPSGAPLYAAPANPADYYANAVRHRPAPRVSVVQLPGDDGALEAGAYPLTVSSFRPNGTVGTATPRATAYAKVDDRRALDLHFYFLDLDEHPCAARFDGPTLDAASARASSHFQGDLVAGLGAILGGADIALGATTYDDLDDIHDLDGIEAADVDTLVAQSSYAGGVHIFFVRTLAPAGLVAMVGRAPGAPGLAGSPASGLVVAADALCYRTWPQLTRMVAYEIARYLGAPRAVEPDGGADRLADTGAARDNLLHFADDGGTALTEGQKRMLRRSPALR